MKMKNFKKMWEENIDGLEDFKGVDYDGNGWFLDENGEYKEVYGFKQISEANAWFTEDYSEFLEMNDEFMSLDEDAAEDILNDVPEFTDYA